jgi:hypothetical protein
LAVKEEQFKISETKNQKMADLVAVGRRKRTEMEAEINTLKNESDFM